MLRVIDREVFDASALVSCSDEALSRMVGDPAAEALALLVQLRRVEVIPFELAIEAQFGLEIGGRNSRPLIREVALEVTEHLRALFPGVHIEAGLVEIDLCPLVDALAHLLAQRAQQDVVHGRHDGTLSGPCPSLLHRCQVKEHALGHEVVEQVPLLMIPVGKELVAEHVNRMSRVIEVVRERHIADALLGGAGLAAIDGMIRRDVELRGLLVGDREAATALDIDIEVTSDGHIKSLKVEVHGHVIQEHIARPERDLGKQEVVIILGVASIDG